MRPRAQFPEKLQFLFQPARYKVLYGGRGGTKSWGIARALLLLAKQRKLRILCARETQHSIADSVHKLLADQIQELGISDCYTVQDINICSTMGSEFVFKGIRHNVKNVKSLEAFDIVWIEEAAEVSKESWETVIPTFRKDPANIYANVQAPAEIWMSFNPELDDDETYVRFVVDPPPNAAVQKLTYRDNPWFPEILRIEMERLKARDYAAYLHVWEGECRSATEGAIYAQELAAAELAGRVGEVSYDRTRPVDTYWDLGFGDKMAIWFAQSVGGWYNVIDYMENKAQPLSYYMIEMQRKEYVYGTHWLPHDGVDAIIHHRLAGNTGDKSRSPEMLMRQAGLRVRIAPKMEVMNGINAARMIFPQCRFDQENCRKGLKALAHYAMGKDAVSGQERRKPIHDWASHGADAFRTMAVGIKQPAMIPVKAAPAKVAQGDYGWMA